MFLLIVSPEPPSLAILTTDQPGELVFDGEPFMEHAAPVDGGPFLGFYDWLRTCDEAVVGVELTLHDNRCEIREILKRATFGVLDNT